MALIVEDGTGLANAESYASIAYSTTYFRDRGKELEWAEVDVIDRERALRMATDYMLQVYRDRWAGSRYTLAQKLDWPRIGVPHPDMKVWSRHLGVQYLYPHNVVPDEVKRACCELAIRARSGELSPDQGASQKRATVGPITVEYVTGSRQVPVYKAVEDYIAPFLTSSRFGPQSIPLQRA